jgi:hypothetical protein
MDRDLPSTPAGILTRDTGELAPPLVEEVHGPVGVSAPDESWNGVYGAAEFVLQWGPPRVRL